MSRILRWIADPLAAIGAWIAGFCLAVMVFISFLQVFFRYVLGSPLLWTDELVRYAGVWMTFIGACVAIRRGELVGVEFLLNHLKGLPRRIAMLIAHGTAVFFLLISIKYGFDLFAFTLRTQ